MELQVLVNHYNEDDATVARFLKSLAMQEGVGFSVLVRGDGGRELDGAFLDGFGLDLEYRYLRHAGVCATRNALLDAATADYIMFCDADDCFTAPDGLLSLMAVARDTGADVIGSPYIAEVDAGGTAHMTYVRDTARVHGKAFRRRYVADNGIRFPDELETSGDMMFLWLAFALTDKVAWVRHCFYMWRHNPDSVTRGLDCGLVHHYPRTLRCFELLDRELGRRGSEDLRDKLAAVLVPMMYLDSAGPQWGHAPTVARREAEKAVASSLARVRGRYSALTEDMKRAGYAAETAAKPECSPEGGFDGMEEWAVDVLESSVERAALIVGRGVVGSNLERELAALSPDVYDKGKGVDTRNLGGYRVAFVCVDTPRTDGSPCDVSEVRNAIAENDADVYVVKSTVLPGTTDALRAETGKRVVFSPEYYGATQHCNNFEFGFTILGGERADCALVVQALQRVYDGRHSFRITDAKTAELAKYMENCYLAAKVSFCCQFADIADSIGVCYEELRELFVLDPRVDPSHTFVYRDAPYWSSHCLDKDVRALADAFDAPLVEGVVRFNESRRARNRNASRTTTSPLG